MGTVFIQPALGASAAASFAADVYAGSDASEMLIAADSDLDADVSSVPWTPVSSSVHPSPFSASDAELRDAYAPTPECSEIFIPGPSGSSVFFRTSPLRGGEKLSRIEDAVFKRAEAFRALRRALLIDTGDAEKNAELRIKIGMMLAKLGLRGSALKVLREVLTIDTGTARENAKLKLKVGKAMAEAGFYDEALAIDTGDVEKNVELKIYVGKAMAGDDMRARALEVWNEALEIWRKALERQDPRGIRGKMMAQQNARFKLDVCAAMAGVGIRDRALLEMLNEVLAVDMGHSWANADFRFDVATVMAEAGFYDEALAIDTGDAEENAKLKFNVATAKAEAGFYDEALAIDTGDAEKNAELRLNVGKAMARAGLYDEALAIDTGDAWKNAELKFYIGNAMAGAGMRERAFKVWKEVIAIDTGCSGVNARLRLKVGKAMAEAGFDDDALEVLREALAFDMGYPWMNARFMLDIGNAMDEVGFHEEALKVWKEALAIDTASVDENVQLEINIGMALAKLGSRGSAFEIWRQVLAKKHLPDMLAKENANFKLNVSKAMAKVGFYDEALAIDTGDAEKNAELKLHVYTVMAEAASSFLADNMVGAQDYLEVAASASAKQLVHMGAAMTMDEIRLVAAALSDGRRDFRRAQDLMTAGRLSVWRVRDDVAGEDCAALIKRHARLVQHAVKTNRALASVYPSLLTLYHLQAAGESGAVSVLLDAGRSVLGKNRADYSLLRILTRCNSSKAKDLAMQGVSSGQLSERQSWLLLERLIEDGYLDEGLSGFIEGRISGMGEDGDAQSKGRSFLLQTIQYVHRELGLCPDVRLMEFVLDRTGDIDAVRSKIAELREHKTTFDAIKDRHELIAKLAADERDATIYFILHGGRTRYALVNNYDLGKFLTIVKKMHAQKIHKKPLKKFLKLFPEERREALRDRLLAGRFPLDGEPGHAIRIDVSGSAQLSAVEGRAAQVFGSGELGALIKAVMYLRSDELTDKERGALENMGGIGDAPAIIAAIEQDHPELAEATAKDLRGRWKKLMGKRVLDVGIDQVFGNETNEVSLGRMVKGLEEARHVLKTSAREKFQKVRKAAQGGVTKEEHQKAREAARLTRDQRLAALEEKARAKLLRYILQDMMIGKGDAKANQLFDEWESHLDQVFTDFEGLKEGAGGGRKEKQVFVRFLDKRDDLVEAVRMADSAQCCFNSKNYIIQNNMGAADWIAMLWSDPLSFAFQIEEYPATNTANAIGFVFGSFGVRDGEPAVLLNGVYMEGKTDAAAQAVLNDIEQRFSRPLGAASQFVASKNAGTSKMDESYSNAPVKVKRLRALAAPNSDKPITVIYDDLNVGVNKSQKTDGHVWHKDF